MQDAQNKNAWKDNINKKYCKYDTKQCKLHTGGRGKRGGKHGKKDDSHRACSTKER